VRYKVVHITEYFYRDLVPLCHNLLHLCPRQTERQVLISNSLSISPHPVSRSDRMDFFGNPVTWFSLQEPHKSLKVVAQSEVDMKPFAPPVGLWWPAWDEVAKMLRHRREREVLDARQFTFDSPFVYIGSEMAEYAKPSFAPGRPLLDCVTELTQRIYKEFTFDSYATTIGTPVLDVLRHKHGVCQDFAHLQIACLRSLGLAARYVSGYLVTKPPPGRQRLVGADTSHAWLSCYFPDFGWIDFDPTNGLIPSAEHITLAWARDYDDISPVRGVVVGGHRHSLAVSVDVEPIAASPSPASVRPAS
jgi:transglutaminase-like putative cysteine protease